MQVNMNSCEPGKAININISPNINTSMFKPGEMPFRIEWMAVYYEEGEDHSFQEDWDSCKTLPTTDFTPQGIIDAVNNNSAQYVRTKSTPETIKEWLNDPDGTMIQVWRGPYIKCANSDEFKGDEAIVLMKVSLKSFLESEGILLENKVKNFYRKEKD